MNIKEVFKSTAVRITLGMAICLTFGVFVVERSQALSIERRKERENGAIPLPAKALSVSASRHGTFATLEDGTIWQMISPGKWKRVDK